MKELDLYSNSTNISSFHINKSILDVATIQKRKEYWIISPTIYVHIQVFINTRTRKNWSGVSEHLVQTNRVRLIYTAISLLRAHGLKINILCSEVIPLNNDDINS